MMPKKAAKKRWFTIAWLDQEGSPHPAFRNENFTRVHRAEKDLLDDLSHGMREFNPHGAYAALVWEGQIPEWDAMHNSRPHFQIWENGDVNVVT